MKGEFGKLAKDELVALRAAIQHAMGAGLSDEFKANLSSAASALDKLITLAEQHKTLDIKVRFDNADIARMVEGYSQQVSRILVDKLGKAPDNATLQNIQRLAEQKAAALARKSIEQQIKAGQPLSAVKLPDTQEVAPLIYQEALYALPRNLAYTRPSDSKSTAPVKVIPTQTVAKDLSLLVGETPGTKLLLEGLPAQQKWDAKREQAQLLFRERQAVNEQLAKAFGIFQESSRQRSFGEVTGRFIPVELGAKTTLDEITSDSKVRKAFQAYRVSDTELSRLVYQDSLVQRAKSLVEEYAAKFPADSEERKLLDAYVAKSKAASSFLLS